MNRDGIYAEFDWIIARVNVVPAGPVKAKEPPPDLEECDGDLAAKRRRRGKGAGETPVNRLPKERERTTVRRTYVEKPWTLTPECQDSFDYVKNACAGTNYKLQFYLAVDASLTGTGGVLFQMKDTPVGTVLGPEHRDKEQIVMFMSFRLSDQETRYTNLERECLAVVKYLAEVRWIIIGSPWPLMLYSEHSALKTVLLKGSEGTTRVVQWESRLSEYDYIVVHHPNTDPIIGLADRLSRMPIRLTTSLVAEDHVPDLSCQALDEEVI
jgi:hypothetical protein